MENKKIDWDVVIIASLYVLALLSVFVVIDTLDISQYYKFYPIIILIVAVGITVIYILFQKNIIVWTQLDTITLAIAISTVVCYFTSDLFLSFKNWIIMAAMLTSGITIFRFRYVRNKWQALDKQKDKYQKSDLKYQRDNPMEKFYLLTEQEVGYDLLNREYLIGKLFHAIEESKSAPTFTISLTGKWGSGKSTIIQNTLPRLGSEFLVISDLNPWEYSDELSLSDALIQKICQKLGIHAPFEITQYITAFHAILGEKTGLNLNVLTSNTNTVAKMQKRIEGELYFQKKRLVIVIDNIERIEADYTLRILKIISTTLKLAGITYILVYDEAELKAMLNINHDYMQKLVQLQIVLPETNEQTIYHTLLEQYIFKKFNLTEGEQDEIKSIWSEYIPNLRQLKRFLNSFAYTLNNRELLEGLNHRDAILFEILAFLVPNMYQEVIRNSEWYMLYHENNGLSELENERKEAYIATIEQNDEYKQVNTLLRKLFPQHHTIYPEYEKVGKGENNHRIYHRAYFTAYLDYQRMGAIVIYDIVSKIFALLKTTSIEERYFQEVFQYEPGEVVIINPEKQSGQVLARLAQTPAPQELNHVAVTDFVEIILKNRYLGKQDNDYTPLYLADIITKLWPYLNKEQYYKIMQADYKNVYIYRSVDVNLALEVEGHRIEFVKLLRKCVDDKINLFSEPYYHRLNIRALIEYQKKANLSANVLHMYFQHFFVLDESNRFLFLQSFIDEVYFGSGYEYTYATEISWNTCIDFDDMKRWIQSMKQLELSDVERLLIEVFEYQFLRSQEEQTYIKRISRPVSMLVKFK